MYGGYYNPHWIEDSYSKSEDESAAKTAKSIGLIIGDEKIEHPDTDIPDPFAPPTPEMRDMIEKTADKMERTNIMSSSELKRVLQNSSDKPHILDSGNRREFETGAVRDIQEGKGRCDLMPIDVIARYLEDDILRDIGEFQNTGSVDPLYDALWKFAPNWGGTKDPIYVSNTTMFLEVAKHYEEGCIKYGERNWQKGIPVRCYIDSAVRHYLKFIRGDKDENHDRSFVWNILGAIWTCVHKPELCEYPIKLEVEG